MSRTAILLLPLLLVSAGPAVAGSLAVAWDDPKHGGAVGLLEVEPPYGLVDTPIPLAADGLLRAAPGVLLHLSRSDGVVTRIDPARWRIEASFDLGSADAPRDLVFVGPDRVWVTRGAASSLLELDLATGSTRDVVDLAPLGAGAKGLAMETALAYEGRVYVQLRGQHGDPAGSHFLAVIDIATESLVDADPEAPGTQAITLAGTAPRFKMQIVPGRDELLLSATGAFQDSGGLERIDLETLESQGVAVREFVDVAGNDLGVFVMMDADRGWLVYSTDIVLSSHLHPFTLSEGGNTPEAANSLCYFAPAIVFDTATNTVFWPEPTGVRAFDASSGLARADATPLDGEPTDIELLPEPGAATWVGLLSLAAMRLLGRSASSRRRP